MQLKTTYHPEFDALIEKLRMTYSGELFNLDGIGEQLDMSKFSKKFFSSNVTADASVDANANVDDVSVVVYNTELPKPFFKLNSYFILWEQLMKEHGLEYANKVVEAQLTGDIYIHDFHGIAAGQPYCFNYSTYDILLQGLPMVKKIKSAPPKHLYAFKSQLEQFTVIASNSTLGATGLADMLVVMSYYVKNILETKEDAHFRFKTKKDVWNYIKENLISFIYTINQPMRANQSPFTNISIYDRKFLEQLKDDYIFPDGSTPDIKIVEKLQALFLDIMNEEMERTPITFPVTTACFSINKNGTLLDKKFVKFIAEKNLKYGFINLYVGESSTLSSCCRLRSDMNSEYFNSFGSGSSKIGSLGVCSVNFPRLAYKAQGDKAHLMKLVKRYTVMAARVNNAKREIVKKRVDNGNLPLYSFGYMELGKQYSTLGVNGFNECIEIMGENILEEDGQALGLEILHLVNKINDKYSDLYDAPHNCEQVPAENMSIKMATKDKLLGYQNEYDIYSNQFIPLITDADMLDRMKLQGKFDKHFSGGAICHINVDTPITEVDKMAELIKTAAKLGIVYWAVNYNLQECKNGHMSVGKGENCTICGGNIVNNYTRVVGFLTNTKNWHKVRREQDYPNRQFYGV